MFRSLGAEVVIVRPLLQTWRHEIESYLAAIGQDHCVDATNSECNYTRNKIRNLVLPQLENVVHPRAKENIVSSAELLSEVLAWLTNEAEAFIESHFEIRDTSVQCHVMFFRKLNPVVAKEVLRLLWQQMRWPLRDMTKQHWQSMWEKVLSEDTVQATDYPGNITLTVDGEILRLAAVRKVS